MDPQHIDPASGEIAPGEYFLRNGFNYDREAASIETGLLCSDPSLTQQQFAEDADINTIVRRFGITGQMPTGLRTPTYGDFEGVTDFRSALAAIDAAEASFMALPGHVRADFNNDPGLFVDFCSDPTNLSKLRELGLAEPVKTPAAPGPDPNTPSSPPPAPPKT